MIRTARGINLFSELNNVMAQVSAIMLRRELAMLAAKTTSERFKVSLTHFVCHPRLTDLSELKRSYQAIVNSNEAEDE